MTPGLILGYLIAVYAIGAFLTALAIGFLKPNMCEDLALLIVYFWPFALIFIGVMRICDAVEDWAYENPSAAHRIGSILDCMTIPFRPITLGRKIREWFDDRKRKV